MTLRSCRRGELPVQRLRLADGKCRWAGAPPVVRSALDAVRLLGAHFEGLPNESAVVLHLDSGYHAVGAIEVALGGIDAVEVDARLVLGSVLSAGVTDFMLLHSHPSGDPKPSAEDVALTDTLADMADQLGLTLADHIVVGRAGRYYSFLERGRFEP